jgi:hypothetical protein
MNGGITTPFDLMLPIDRFAEISSHPAGRLATSSATIGAALAHEGSHESRNVAYRADSLQGTDIKLTSD